MSSGGAFQYSRAGGVYVPAGWGDLWRAARAQSSQRLVSVLSWGDSIFAGYYTSDFRTKGPVTSLVAALQARYGDGGSGIQMASDLTGIITGTTGATYGAITGAWSTATDALAEFYVSPNVAATGTLQWPTVRGSVVDVWLIPTIGSVSTVEVRIDGVLVDTVNQAQTTGPVVVHTYNVADGTHVVLLTVTAGRPGVCAVRGRRAVGVIGHQCAVAGRGSSIGAASALTPGAVSTAAYTVAQTTPDLLLVDYGINDIAFATSADAYLTGIQRIVSAVKNQATPAEVLLCTCHFGNTADPNFLATRYARGMRDVAQTMGCAWVNFWADGRASWNNWHDKGFWGITGSATGNAGNDVVHVSDAGAAHMASVFAQLLLG